MPEIIHNKRSAAQWEIISQRVDFGGKTVLDLGCGYGDILVKCWRNGAAKLTAFEQNSDIYIHRWLEELIPLMGDSLDFHWCAIEALLGEDYPLHDASFDIAICFSVLPYLYQRENVVSWIREHSTQALIECQYSGDGPGLDFLKDDDGMQRWLRRAGWQQVEAIGKTLVEGRNKYRTIWLCG